MESVKTHFSKTVGDYDTVADKVVFKNDELHNVLVNAICFDTHQTFSVLDLGCGTGHGISLIAKRFPHSVITGIDFSPRMIEKSKNTLLSLSDRVHLIELDFREYDFRQKFDVIVSAIAIHNISHEQKKDLFRNIVRALHIGGMFINADFYRHESDVMDEILKSTYRRYMRENLAGDELNVWLKHAFEEDMPMKLSEQASFLADIGFTMFELLWMFNNQAIYRVKKSCEGQECKV